MQTRGGKSGCPCHDLLALSGTEARVAPPEGILERVVQHGCADVEEELHRRTIPAHLLRLTWGVSLSRVRSSANADGRWRAVGPAPRRGRERRVELAVDGTHAECAAERVCLAWALD